VTGVTCHHVVFSFVPFQVFQIILGMRLRTFLTTQVQNMHKLLECLPDAETNKGLARGPVLVMDRGFGKMDHIEEVMKKNFKLITVAATLGSQHPFVPTSAMQNYRDKLKQKKKSEELSSFNQYIEKWEVKDDAKVLCGPELFSATNKSNPDLHAVAIRDIFDKKILRKS
jgi:hypothetical protein